MKRTIRILGIILIISILTTNISYATIMTTEQLNTSIEKLFSSDIKIETNSENEFGTSTGTMTIHGGDVKLEGNQIILTEEDSNVEFIINYAIEDNVCKFESSVDLQIDENSTEEAWNAVGLLMYQMSSLNVCYLAVADALGIDLSLAYTYYSQNSGESMNVENDIFSIKANLPEEDSSETVSTILLEVNWLEMAQLDSSKIDETSSSTVTLVERNEGDPPVDEEGEEQNPPSNESGEEEKNPPVDEESGNVEQKPSTDEDVKTDDTLANKEIPKAGAINIVYVMSIITIIALILYLKSKKYEDIK